MSFILDALKKAESERSRKSGPVLMDVRIAAPRRRLPTWAWVLGGVLLANLAVLAWLLLRTPQPPPTSTGSPAIAAPAVATAASPPTAPMPASAAPLSVPLVPPATSSLQAPAAQLPATQPELPLEIENLPTAQDLLASGVTLPTLQLNLHVYDAAPANRYVLLNSVRLREGEFTPDGIKVERITPRGVILESRGRRFLLSAGG